MAASPGVGDEATLNASLTVIRDEYDNGIRYADVRPMVPPLLLEDTQAEILAFTKSRAAWEYRWAPGVVETAVTATRLGAILAHRFGLNTPRALIAHRDTALPYHQDTRMPYACVNLALFFTRGCEGGEVIVGGRAFAAQDRWALIFDGQQLHGVAPISLAKGGYRCSLTWYCPKEPA